jgi:aspartyl-tRNA(Asn)/glutamyl-tRNA(Gln) amidotransferase subunit C
LYDVSRVVTLPDTVPVRHVAGPRVIPEGPTVKLDLETVERIAALARVGLTPDEMERMRDQLSAVLDHISMLEEVDTDQIPPTAQVIELQNIMRDDIVEPSLSQQQVLFNAPRTEDGFIKVKAVLDGS